MTNDDLCPTGNAILGIGCGSLLSIPFWIAAGLIVRLIWRLL